MRSMVLAILVGAVSLSGCSVFQIGDNEYTCKANQLGGVACHSAREVYDLTNNVSYLTPEMVVDKTKKSEAAGKQATSTASASGFQKDAVSTPEKTVPVRTPATIMRAWFGPYQDENDMLHSSEKVFAEISPRTWSLGETAVGEKESRIIKPLQSPGSKVLQDFSPLGGNDRGGK